MHIYINTQKCIDVFQLPHLHDSEQLLRFDHVLFQFGNLRLALSLGQGKVPFSVLCLALEVSDLKSGRKKANEIHNMFI